MMTDMKPPDITAVIRSLFDELNRAESLRTTDQLVDQLDYAFSALARLPISGPADAASRIFAALEREGAQVNGRTAHGRVRDESLRWLMQEFCDSS